MQMVFQDRIAEPAADRAGDQFRNRMNTQPRQSGRKARRVHDLMDSGLV
jgi:hypothetical protein